MVSESQYCASMLKQHGLGKGDKNAECKSGGSDKDLALPARPRVGVPGLAIAQESNSPSNVTLPAKPKVEGLGLAITGGSDLSSISGREGRTNDFRTCPGVSLEPDSYGASVRPLLVDNQSSPWQSVAADDPNSIGGPPDLRETGESRTNPWSEFISPNAATKNLNDIAGTTSERLPDHCPTCSANLELRDRTHGIILSTCMFCHTERPRQVNASLENMPTTWSPPVRVLTATLLSGNTPKQTRSRSPSPSHPESSYRHRSHSLSLTDSDFDVIEDPYKPYHYWKKNSKNEKYREEWKTIHRKFCKKRRRMEQMKDVV